MKMTIECLGAHAYKMHALPINTIKLALGCSASYLVKII